MAEVRRCLTGGGGVDLSAAEPEAQKSGAESTDRRGFLRRASSVVMTGGVVLAYGTCATYGGRFLYPARPARRRWQYLTSASSLGPGEALLYRAPNGDSVTVTRQGDAGTVEDFVALSSTCPHLGCRVKWEPHKERFHCPCHNGVFDVTGKALSGPPADAGTDLFRYPLKLDKGNLFIEVELEGLTVEEV